MLALTVSSLVLAQGSPYEVDWTRDLTLTTSVLVFHAIAEAVVNPGLGGERACRMRLEDGLCDPQQLVWLDSRALGERSAGWRVASDWIMVSALALPLAASGVDASDDGGGRLEHFGRDVLVMTEAVALTQVATQLFKYSMRRARPSQYVIDTDVTFVEEQLSFPSGHTSTVAAAAAAYAFTFHERHPRNAWRWGVIGGGVALTALTGYARTAAGRHFPTDVIAGAVLGGTIGFLVPYLHRSKDAVDGAALGQVTPLLALAGTF